MLVFYVVGFLLILNGQCHTLNPPSRSDYQNLFTCMISILNKYFAKYYELTFVDIQSYEDDLLKAIHSTTKFTLISRVSTQQVFVPNIGYLISSGSTADFIEYFHYLIQERTWNPNGRFLIIIKFLDQFELRLIFNELLTQHVINVLIVNGTENAHLYTYNPYENYACGRYYNRVIRFGRCLQATNNLYPNKLVTGLKKCNFTATTAHRPPFSVDPLKTERKKTLLGIEEYIITLLSEKEHFTVAFNYNYNDDLYSTVEPNMTAFGPMQKLQRNECDIMFGGLLMVPSRADAFAYLSGYYDYSDELLYVVKKACFVPIWKYVYLEFQPEVWILLLIALIVYTIAVIMLLDSKDKSEVVLRLLDNMLLHGRDMHTRLSVKFLLVTWAICMYIINTFYQSSLFSFTTHPIREYQVSDEQDFITYHFKPCVAQSVREYIYTEVDSRSQEIYFRTEGCETTNISLSTVSTTNYVLGLVPTNIFLYNEANYTDKWGEPMLYRLQQPFMKYLYCFYFQKGFPVTHSLRLNALRMKESGLVDKKASHHYYRQWLKKKFTKKTFESHFQIPWCIFILGLIIATITFVLEILNTHSKWFKRVTLRLKLHT